MFEFLHVAPGADWVIIFMAIAGGFALYIGIGIILELSRLTLTLKIKSELPLRKSPVTRAFFLCYSRHNQQRSYNEKRYRHPAP